MARQPTDARPSSRKWILIGVIEQSVLMLAEDICRIYLERGPRTDVLHLRFEELGSSLDRDLEYPAVPGADTDAARAALEAAARDGMFSLRLVVAGGALSGTECAAILESGTAHFRQERDRVKRLAERTERREPSRIVAAASELGLRPEPVGARHWVARCPETNHTIMISPGTETFGCGYCRIKGGPDELAGFVARRRGKRHGR